MENDLIETVNSAQLDAAIGTGDMPVIVDVWAPWCGPCHAMAPHFEAAARTYTGQARFLKLNADENQAVVRRYKIMGIPTVLYFKHGKLVDRKAGVQNAHAIEKRVQPLLHMSPDDVAANERRGWFHWPFRSHSSG